MHGNTTAPPEVVTMRAPQELPATVLAEPVTIPAQRLNFQALFTLELPMPQPDADLPKLLEAGIERGGQLLKRRLFPQALDSSTDCGRTPATAPPPA